MDGCKYVRTDERTDRQTDIKMDKDTSDSEVRSIGALQEAEEKQKMKKIKKKKI